MQKQLLPLTIFTASYLLVAACFALLHQNWEFIVYIIVVLALGTIVLSIHRRIHFSLGLLWLLSIWGLLHMIGGLVSIPLSWPIDGDKHVFYSWWIIPDYLKFDQVVHAYGFSLATWASWQGLKAGANVTQPTFGLLTLCVFAGMGFGALNEVIEFMAVLAIPDTNVGGYINTGWDLVSNLVGTVIAAFIIRFGSRS